MGLDWLDLLISGLVIPQQISNDGLMRLIDREILRRTGRLDLPAVVGGPPLPLTPKDGRTRPTVKDEGCSRDPEGTGQ